MTEQTRLEEGDVIKVLEAHDGHRPGAILVIEEVIRADDPESDFEEEYSIVNGSSVMGGTAITSKVERVYTKAEYERTHPTWKNATDQIKDALSGVEGTTYVEVASSGVGMDPPGFSGVSALELTFLRDDGHAVQATAQITGRVLSLDEMA